MCGGYITFDAFEGDEKLSSLDECHYTSDAAVVYTYLHFKKGVSRQTLTLFMNRMRVERNIILFDIFGYDSIASTTPGNDLTDHVGFQMLVHHYRTKNPSFKSCTDGMPGISRGIIWKCDSIVRLKELINGRSKTLGQFFDGMVKELNDYKQKADTIDLMREQMAEYEVVIERYRERVDELRHFKFVCHVLKTRIGELDQATQDILLAADHKGRPL
jgi:hypothetical protein